MANAATPADKIGKPSKSTARVFNVSLMLKLRKFRQSLMCAKPKPAQATAAGALVIAFAAAGILLVSPQFSGPDATTTVADGAVEKPGLAPPAEPMNSLARATKNVSQADLRPVVKKAIAVSASRKIADLTSLIRISEVQRLLTKLDFRPGPPDGVLGHRTVNAIRLYQKFGGLEITGHATPELLLDLRAVAARMPEPTG